MVEFDINRKVEKKNKMITIKSDVNETMTEEEFKDFVERKKTQLDNMERQLNSVKLRTKLKPEATEEEIKELEELKVKLEKIEYLKEAEKAAKDEEQLTKQIGIVKKELKDLEEYSNKKDSSASTY